jgi:hypothetical protein
MYVNRIYAGPVALAHALAVASRVQSAPAASAGRLRPLKALAAWLSQPQKLECQTPDPVQLMLWSECAGRNYTTALGGMLVMKHFARIWPGRRRS